MKKFAFFAALFLTHAAFAADTQNTVANKLAVQLDELNNANGNVIVCLWRPADTGFPDCTAHQPFRKLVLPASHAQVLFDKIPAGEYAVSAMHDEHRTGKLETTLIGIPKQGVGVSRVDDLFALPDFDACKITVPETQNLKISMNYFD